MGMLGDEASMTDKRCRLELFTVEEPCDKAVSCGAVGCNATVWAAGKRWRCSDPYIVLSNRQNLNALPPLIKTTSSTFHSSGWDLAHENKYYDCQLYQYSGL